MTTDQAADAAANACPDGHHWITAISGSGRHSLHVRICSLCRGIDWDDLAAQVTAERDRLAASVPSPRAQELATGGVIPADCTVTSGVGGCVIPAEPRAQELASPAPAPRVVPHSEPLYAAYRAAREWAERHGEEYTDDGIIQAAVMAYEAARAADAAEPRARESDPCDLSGGRCDSCGARIVHDTGGEPAPPVICCAPCGELVDPTRLAAHKAEHHPQGGAA